MQSEQVVTELVVDSRKSASGTDSYVRDMQRAGTATEQATQKVELQGRALSYTERQAQAYLGQISPVIAAQNRLGGEARQAESAIKSLDRQLMTGSITANDHAQKMALVTGRLGEVRLASQQLAAGVITAEKAMGQATVSTGQMRFAVKDLGFQLNDLATQIASGGGIFRPLVQQAGQIQGAFSAGGGVGATLGAFATSIRSMITPTTAVVAGLAAVTAGVVFLALRSNTSTEAIRQFNVVLQGMSVQSLASAQGLETAAKSLLDVGVNAAEARRQITDVTRAGLNPATAPQIVRAGANLSAYLGGDQTAALTQALAGGVDSAAKYAVQVGALTGAQAAFRQELARTTPGAKVLDDILQQITSHAEGMYQKGLSPLGKALNEAKVAFDQFFESMSKSGEIQGFIKGITDTIKELDHIARVMGQVKGFFSSQPVATADIPPAAAAGGAAGTLSYGQIKQLAINAGFQGPSIDTITAISLAESRGVSSAHNTKYPDDSYGLTQINALAHGPIAKEALDPQRALELAFSISKGGTDFRPWSTWLDRKYTPYLQTGTGPEEMPAAGGGAPGLAGAGTAVTEQAISQARQMTAARLADAQATAGQGLEQEKLQVALQVSREREKGLLTEQELATMQAGLLAAAKTRLTNEIKNAADAAVNEVTGQRNIADAYLQGSKAGLVMESAVKAATEAFAKFGTVSSAESKQFAADRLREITALEGQAERVKNNRDLLTQTEGQEQLRLQISLTGQLPEIAQRELTLLQAKQQITRDFPLLTEQEKNNRLAMVQATADLNVKLAETQRAQQRMDDLFRSIGDSISSTIGTAITNIFDGKKITDWGAMLKGIMSSVVSQIAQSLLIRPLIGSLLSSLGASASVVNGFGSLGGIFGSGSSGSTSSGGLSTGTLLQGGGLLKDLFGGSSSSSGGFLSNIFGGGSTGIGGSLGFGYTDASLANLIGIESSYVFPGSSGLLGGGTLGGLLGGVGLGAGAGGLLAGLLGGNSMLGSLGGGVAGIAGTLIGGPIGGLLGGALGGLLGMFGNKKPSNASAGANFDLSNFSLTAGFSGGNSQIDQSTKQVAEGVQSFLALLKTTGGALSGNVLLQNGVNTGFTADSSLPGYEGRFSLGKDPTAALNTIELALAKSLTGVSDAMRQVLDQVSDPAQIERVIAGATAYDALKTAADDAFKTVEEAAKTTAGPFAQAMTAIKTKIGEVSDFAKEFGLSLDPVNAALAEATTRLQGDFTDSLNRAFNEATGAGFLNQLQSVYDQTIVAMQESIAIGLGDDPATQTRISELEGAGINAILSPLSTDQLDQVIEQFTGLNDTIVDLAISAQGATDATAALAAAQLQANQILQATTQIQDYLNSLNTTAGAYTSPESALLAAQAEYNKELALAQGGDINALLGITGDADALVKAIEAYYGSSAAGQAMVDAIKQQLTGLETPTVTDPVVITNTLLTEQVTQTTAVNDNVIAASGAQIDALNTLAGMNTDAANAAIAQNMIDAANLIAANDQAATDTIAANDIAAQALIASNDQSTADIVAQNDVASQALIAANDQAALDTIAANNAASSSLIASNDSATGAIIASSSATTSQILAGSSADATAIGLVTQNVGDEIAGVMTIVADNTISAVFGAANGVISAANIFANSQVSAIFGAANGIITAENVFANNQVLAIYGATNSLISVGATFADSQITATFDAANSLISVGAVYANDNLIALANLQNSSEVRLESINGTLLQLWNNTVLNTDTSYAQRNTMIALLTEIREAIRLLNAGTSTSWAA